MKIPKLLIAVIFALIIFLRFVFDDNSELMIMVTVFNIVATLIVLLDIADGAKEAIVQKIEKTCAAPSISVREKKRFKKLFWSILSVGVLLFVGLALKFCCSSLGNDVLSMGSLGISLLNDEIIQICKNLYKV